MGTHGLALKLKRKYLENDRYNGWADVKDNDMVEIDLEFRVGFEIDEVETSKCNDVEEFYKC